MQVEVADPKDKIVNLGARLVNDVVKKYIPIINNSPSAITFSLALTPTAPALQKASSFASQVLSITPTNSITLEPKGGTCKVALTFSPGCRIPQFTEEVKANCYYVSPLFYYRVIALCKKNPIIFCSIKD